MTLQKQKEKFKPCAICGASFRVARFAQKVCSYICATEYTRQQKIQAEKKEQRKIDKQRKEALKSRSDWMKEAQAEFNRFIRLRDAHLPCISCGTHTAPQWAAGHYRTVGANPELRFNELNVHKQCNKNCNESLSGNIIEYRKGLLKKIGAEALEWLEGPHDPAKLSIDDIKAIKATYRAKCRELEKVAA